MCASPSGDQRPPAEQPTNGQQPPSKQPKNDQSSKQQKKRHHTKRFTAQEEALRVEAIVDAKERDMAARGRCERCWHNARDGHCICARLETLRFRLDVRFVLYTHHKEYYCAGDDARSSRRRARRRRGLRARPPRRRRAAGAILRAPCAERRCLLLFPDDGAATVDSFFAAHGAAPVPARGAAAGAPFYVVVVDATWTLARKMARHLDRLLGNKLPHVKLDTDLVSVYARTQSKTGRVCTVEAVALFLREVGESDELFRKMVAMVETNNR
ncbi:hypothetical protein JL722_3011 [Aureococcus anophagefferens]|nr:hypothetical protein JL722_3011 [Aureococcus anophagefferens]